MSDVLSTPLPFKQCLGFPGEAAKIVPFRFADEDAVPGNFSGSLESAVGILTAGLSHRRDTQGSGGSAVETIKAKGIPGRPVKLLPGL